MFSSQNKSFSEHDYSERYRFSLIQSWSARKKEQNMNFVTL
jgi:hypothetical protein